MPPPPDGIGWAPSRKGFRQLLSEAVADLAATGFVSPERIEEWVTRLRNAADRDLGADHTIDQETRAKLGAVYARLTNGSGIAKAVPGITRFNVAIVKPHLRAELDRRIWAAADLIKMNKKEAVERTTRRLQAWATSIPPGGDDTIDRRETKTDIGKSVAQFKFERRRVDIDQSAKLIANVTHLVAVDAGAIAGVWHDHGEHDKSYNARKEHMARAGKIYVLRDSWAYQQGLIKAPDGFTDDVTAPAQEPFCRCFYRYVRSPRRLPDQMLTRKGQEWVERGRLALAQEMAA